MPVVVNVVLLSGYAGAVLGYGPARWVALAGLVAWVPVWVAWLGYYVRVVRRTAAGEASPPRPDGWLAVVRDGVVGTLLVVGGRLFGVAAVLESDAGDRDAPTITDL